MKTLTILILPLLSFITPILCYGSGAPSVACKTMIPDHGFAPQTTPSPYKVILNTTKLDVKGRLEITLTSKSGRDEFLGFLVQMRLEGPNSNEKSYGDFVAVEDNARTLACDNRPNNAATHKSNAPKKVVKVHWMPQEPGKYRVYTTFVKTGDSYWTAMPHEEVIEVTGTKGADSSHHPDMEYDIKKLCSDMKLNDSLTPQTEASNPYLIMVGSVKFPSSGAKDKEQHGGDNHKIEQKGLMWINVTSEIGTPILKLFMQVRRPKSPSKSYGKFVVKMGKTPEEAKLSYELVDCFGGDGNAMLFMNMAHNLGKVSDVAIQWEAPHNETGEFEVIATALSEEDTFWGKLGEDPEAAKIRVVKGSGTSSKPGGSSSGQHSSSSSGSYYPHIMSVSFLPMSCLLYSYFYFLL